MDGTFYGRNGLVDELASRLPTLTLEEVNSAISRHLTPESLAVAVVADPAGAPALIEAIATNAPSPIAYGTETRPEVLAEDREIAVEPLPIERGRCRMVSAGEMFEQ